jgi:mycothiol synthase
MSWRPLDPEASPGLAAGDKALRNSRRNARESEPVSVRFLDRHGFVPIRRTWMSRLTLTDLDPSNFPDRSKLMHAAGIRITTLANEGPDRPEVRHRLYEQGRTSSIDTPRMGEYYPPSFEEFIAMSIEYPTALPEAIFLACHGSEYVGWSTLPRVLASPDTLDIGFTGTLRKYRGRGIASELKRHAVEYARSHGYSYIITGNDSLNTNIWAINEKLGFRREQTLIQAEKTLASARDSVPAGLAR